MDVIYKSALFQPWLGRVSLFCASPLLKGKMKFHTSLVLLYALGYGNTECGVQTEGSKLERFLPKNQHTQRNVLNFENWTNPPVWKLHNPYCLQSHKVITVWRQFHFTWDFPRFNRKGSFALLCWYQDQLKTGKKTKKKYKVFPKLEVNWFCF